MFGIGYLPSQLRANRSAMERPMKPSPSVPKGKMRKFYVGHSPAAIFKSLYPPSISFKATEESICCFS
jgi:hypothetical protein